MKKFIEFVKENVYSKLEDEYEESVINVFRKSLDYYEELTQGKTKITFKDGSTAYIDPIAFTKVSTNDEKPTDADYFVRAYKEGISYDKLENFVKRNCPEIHEKSIN